MPWDSDFLASGKYFLVNNGPYYQTYDVPIDEKNSNWNLFFHQGQARSWIARTPLAFDKWIPSVLFLTHYFPDDPRQWQEVSVASLILGQNGIWGDLPAVSDAGVDFIGSSLSKYKQVRADITESDPVVTGIVSGSPEIHEKVSSTSGRGAVVIFATSAGRYTYITTNKTAAENWASDGVTVSRDSEGKSQIDATFARPGAKMIFFGVHKNPLCRQVLADVSLDRAAPASGDWQSIGRHDFSVRFVRRLCCRSGKYSKLRKFTPWSSFN